MRQLLQDIVTSSDANDYGSLMNAIEAARTFLNSAECEHNFQTTNVCTKCGIEGASL